MFEVRNKIKATFNRVYNVYILRRDVLNFREKVYENEFIIFE